MAPALHHIANLFIKSFIRFIGAPMPPSPEAAPASASCETLSPSRNTPGAASAKTQPDADHDRTPSPEREPVPSSAGQEVIAVAREEIKIGTEKQETRRVRITKRIRTREEVVDQPTITEELEITRVPINRPVDGPVAVRTEGDTTIVPVVEEVLVMQKRLILREEVRSAQAAGGNPPAANGFVSPGRGGD